MRTRLLAGRAHRLSIAAVGADELGTHEEDAGERDQQVCDGLAPLWIVRGDTLTRRETASARGAARFELALATAERSQERPHRSHPSRVRAFLRTRNRLLDEGAGGRRLA